MAPQCLGNLSCAELLNVQVSDTTGDAMEY
jgi:hypothetical protein